MSAGSMSQNGNGCDRLFLKSIPGITCSREASDVTLPKKYRLKHTQDFKSVFRNGLQRRGRYVVMRFQRAIAPNSGSCQGDLLELPSRLGVSVSQKVSKRAVVRNRIKRRLKSAFWQLLPRFREGWDIVLVVQPAAIQCDYEQFLQELKQLLLDAEVIDGY
jgi:ribonuclease P protein component